MVVVLLEVQVGIGYIIDFVISVWLIVDEVVCVGLVGFEFYEKLLLVEKVVIGYRDFYIGQSVFLFQVLKKGFIFWEQGLCLLDVQLFMGGIVDFSKSYCVFLDVVCV